WRTRNPCRSYEPLYRAQLRTARARIADHFRVTGNDRLPGEDADRLFAGGQRPEHMFHNPVLERVKRDHGESCVGAEQARGGEEKCVKALQLPVHPDSQRLKRARRRIDSLVAPAGTRTAHDLRELPGRGDGTITPRVNDGSGDAAGKALFAVL